MKATYKRGGIMMMKSKIIQTAKMMFWTDYPFDNEEGLKHVELLVYDGNKYIKVLYKDNIYEMKACYLCNKKEHFKWRKRKCKTIRLALIKCEKGNYHEI